MSITPGDRWPTDSSSVTAGFIAQPPIQYNPTTKFLSVTTASSALTGVVSVSAQSFAGVKTFLSNPRCSTMPSVAEGLCNKAYVDSLVSQSLSWKSAVIAVQDMVASPPASPSDGDRYISTTTGGGFTANNIYQYDAAAVAWIETTVDIGDATFVISTTSPYYPQMSIYYDSSLKWSPFSGAINHSSLLGLAGDDHTQYVMVSGRSGDAVSIPNSTASTSTTTGALKVAGGIGCAGDIYGGATINAATYVVTPKLISFPNSIDAKKFVVKDEHGGTDCRSYTIGMIAASEMAFNVDTPGFYSFYYANGPGARIKGMEFLPQTSTGYLSILPTTASTSTTTGALKVAGGIGCAGSIFASSYNCGAMGSNVYLANFLSTDCASGSLVGINIGRSTTEDTGCIRIRCYPRTDSGGYGDLQIKNTSIQKWTLSGAEVLPTTASTSTTTGALTVAGGIGCAATVFAEKYRTPNTEVKKRIVFYDNTPTPNEYQFIGMGLLSGEFRFQLHAASNHFDWYYGTGAASEVSLMTLRAPYDTGYLGINITTASSSTTTGALRVSGGIGCGGAIHCNQLNVTNGTNAYLYLGQSASERVQCEYIHSATAALREIAFSIPGTAWIARMSGTTTTISPATVSTSTTTGALVVTGGVGIGGDLYVGGSLNISGSVVSDWSGGASFFKAAQADTESYYVKFGKADASKQCGSLSFYYATAEADRYIALNMHSCNGLKITDTLASITHTAASTSASTGALTVAGGCGVAGALYAGGELVSLATTASTNTVSGAIVAYGGFGVAKRIYCGEGVYVTPSGSGDAEAFVALAPSIAVGKKISIGFGKSWATDECAAWAWFNATDAADRRVQLDLYGTEVMRSTKSLTTMKLPVSISDTTASSSTTTGALICAGGMGVAGKLYVGGDVNFSSTTASTSASTGALTVAGGCGVAGAVHAGGIIRTHSTTTSTTINTGALLVDGGCGIHENLNVGGTFTCGLDATNYTDQWGSMTGGANVTITARLVAGKCTLQCEGEFSGTASDTASLFNLSIAAKYRPAANLWFPLLVSDDSSYIWAAFEVRSDGALYLGSWASSSAIVVKRFSISYYVGSPNPPE